MLSNLNTLFIQLLSFSKSNPIIASAFGLWGMTVIGYLVRDIPLRIWSFVVNQTTTTLDLNSQDQIYHQFLTWISKNKMNSLVRSLNFNNGLHMSGHGYRSETKPKYVAIGYGRMFFFHDKKFFIVTRQKIEATQTDTVKETLQIRVVSRSHKAFDTLFKLAIKKDPKEEMYTKIHTFHDDYWEPLTQQFKRHLNTIILNDDIEKKLTDTIDRFIASRDWYIKNGVPYKLGILLHGPPGTGKTSLIKALCAKYERELFLLNLGTLSDRTILKAFQTVPENSIVAIEDIDVQNANVDREDESKSTLTTKLSLSGLLNGLDGAASSENRIAIATTNDISKLDPALIRDGRFDLILSIDNLNESAIKKYLARFYTDVPETLSIANVSPAKLQRLVFENREDITKVLNTFKQDNINNE